MVCVDQNKIIYLFLSVEANSSIISLACKRFSSSFSIDSIDRSDSLSSVVVVPSRVLVLFIVEKDLSVSVLVTAIVEETLTSLQTVLYAGLSDRRYLPKSARESILVVFCDLIRLHSTYTDPVSTP